jgi:ELWxxDGT repeat protein
VKQVAFGLSLFATLVGCSPSSEEPLGAASQSVFAEVPRQVQLAPKYEQQRHATGGVQVGPMHLFTLSDHQHGTELWKTDGSLQGTRMVIDLVPGPGSSYLEGLVLFDGQAFFKSGDDLYRTQGTSATTVRVNTGALMGRPAVLGRRLIAVAHGKIFALESATGAAQEIFADDSLRSTELQHAVLGDKLYFRAKLSSDLWVTDGTAAGTAKVATVEGERGPVAVGGKLFFYTRYGGELRVSDGTAAGTVSLGRFDKVADLTALGGQIYFLARQGTSGEAGLWRTDGTVAGTAAVELGIGPRPDFKHLVRVGDRLVLFATLGASSHPSLFSSDGTAQGTASLGEGVSTHWLYWDDHPQLLSAGEVLYFEGRPGAGSTLTDHKQLWRTDGTAAGTRAVTSFDTRFSVEPVAQIGGGVLFEDYGDLWFTDPSAPGGAVKINSEGEMGESYRSIFDLGGKALWITHEGNRGHNRLWSLEGGAPVQLAQVSGFKSDPVQVGARVFFLVAGNNDEAHLWKSDGTAAGTGKVTTVTGRWGIQTASLNDRLYFTLENGSFDHQLWESDGTAAGTRMLRSYRSKPYAPVGRGGRLFYKIDSELYASVGSGPESLVSGSVERMLPTENGLYFVTGFPSYGLWKIDLDSGAPRQVARDTRIYQVVEVGQTVYVQREEGVARLENGSFVTVKSGKRVRGLQALGNELAFWMQTDAGPGLRPWITSGTSAEPLADVTSVGWISEQQPKQFVPYAGGWLFAASTREEGGELWFTEGTPARTAQRPTLFLGVRSSAPAAITRVGNAVYFGASSRPGETGLWKLGAE